MNLLHAPHLRYRRPALPLLVATIVALRVAVIAATIVAIILATILIDIMVARVASRYCCHVYY